MSEECRFVGEGEDERNQQLMGAVQRYATVFYYRSLSIQLSSTCNQSSVSLTVPWSFACKADWRLVAVTASCHRFHPVFWARAAKHVSSQSHVCKRVAVCHRSLSCGSSHISPWWSFVLGINRCRKRKPAIGGKKRPTCAAPVPKLHPSPSWLLSWRQSVSFFLRQSRSQGRAAACTQPPFVKLTVRGKLQCFVGAGMGFRDRCGVLDQKDSCIDTKRWVDPATSVLLIPLLFFIK